MSKPPPPAPTASAIGPCPTIIQIVGRPGTGSLPRTIAPPDHPLKIVGKVWCEEPDQHRRGRWEEERKERKDMLRAGQSRGSIVYANGIMHYKAK